MQNDDDPRMIASLKEAREATVPSKERFTALFAALAAGKTPPPTRRLPQRSPFAQFSDLFTADALRIHTVRTVNGIVLIFDYALIKTPKQIGKFAEAAWKVCVKRLD